MELRKSRALHEMIYLMERPTEDTFIVMGSRGYPYTIRKTSPEVFSCTCMDFENHEDEFPPHRCKHIWFVLLRVLVKKGGSSPKRKRSHVEEPPLKKRWEARDECPICFEAMEQESELRFCKECGKPFHIQCFEQWATYHHRKVPCPYCRTELVK